jgi:hypothetical protein
MVKKCSNYFAADIKRSPPVPSTTHSDITVAPPSGHKSGKSRLASVLATLEEVERLLATDGCFPDSIKT